jgi:hypothetical protein
MLIARWLLLLAGLGICVSVALYIWTGNARYWHLARRLFTATAAAAILFFAILMLERLAV